MMPLYCRLLGAQFDQLPDQVRDLHNVMSAARWSGRADVVRGSSIAARLIATLFGLPPEGSDQALTVTFEPSGDAEVWVMDQDGSNAKQLTTDRLYKELPVASSDGKYIVYSFVRFIQMY